MTTIDLVDAEAVADRLGVPAGIVERLALEGRIPSMDVPVRMTMFDLPAVLECVGQRQVAGVA